jgi:intergrase/recombinase
MYMTKKIDVASLPEFNAASFMTDYEDIKAYIRVVKEEGDPVALGQALKPVFMALGARVVSDALNIETSRVWDAQEMPLEHLETLRLISDVIENGALVENTDNPHQGSDFIAFLKAEGIFSEVNARALRRVLEALKQRSQ